MGQKEPGEGVSGGEKSAAFHWLGWGGLEKSIRSVTALLFFPMLVCVCVSVGVSVRFCDVLAHALCAENRKTEPKVFRATYRSESRPKVVLLCV